MLIFRKMAHVLRKTCKCNKKKRLKIVDKKKPYNIKKNPYAGP